MNELNLDELVVSQGQEFDETKNKKLEGVLMYDEPTIMPTAGTTITTADEVALSKDDAESELVSKLAEAKLAREKEAFSKLSDNEKLLDYMRQMQYYRSTNDFFRKNGYEMNGKQKRLLKRECERSAAKWVKQLTQTQKDEILLELNNQYRSKAVNAADVAGATKEKVTSLSALMH